MTVQMTQIRLYQRKRQEFHQYQFIGVQSGSKSISDREKLRCTITYQVKRKSLPQGHQHHRRLINTIYKDKEVIIELLMASNQDLDVNFALLSNYSWIASVNTVL